MVKLRFYSRWKEEAVGVQIMVYVQSFRFNTGPDDDIVIQNIYIYIYIWSYILYCSTFNIIIYIYIFYNIKSRTIQYVTPGREGDCVTQRRMLCYIICYMKALLVLTNVIRCNSVIYSSVKNNCWSKYWL